MLTLETDMKSTNPDRWIHWLGIGLLLLLPALAGLQYRWIGQLSSAENARMQSMLVMGLMQIEERLTLLFDAHASEVGTLMEMGETHLAKRFQTWKATTPYPNIFAGLYRVQPTASGHPRLETLSTQATSWKTIDWPTDWVGWPACLTALLQPDLHKPLPSCNTASPPGLVIPNLPDVHGTDIIPVTMHLLLLNPTALRTQLIPVLIDEHLAAGGTLDYEVKVIQTEAPGHILYTSTSDWTGFGTPDAAVPIGSSRELAFSYKNTSNRSIERTVTVDEHVDIRIPNGKALRPWNEPQQSDDLDHETLLIQVPTPQWTLQAWHKAGSLEAAVRRNRRGNLAVSFGTLLILGLAIGLVIASARQARRLAAQQMAFVAGVSHELRTPLAVIRSAAENLAHGVIRQPDRAQQYGRLIQDEEKRLSDMIEQVLALAGAESGQSTAAFQPVDLSALVHQTLKGCQQALSARDMHVVQHLPDGLPPAYGEAHMLEMALRNLILNAVKYSDPGKQVYIEAAYDPATAHLMLNVRDEGMGIPAHEVPHVFEPFFRGETSRAQQIRGNGIGLSLVQRILEAHNGQVTVTSALNQGSTFTLHLPTAI